VQIFSNNSLSNSLIELNGSDWRCFAYKDGFGSYSMNGNRRKYLYFKISNFVFRYIQDSDLKSKKQNQENFENFIGINFE
jgi:hypothetical protein